MKITFVLPAGAARPVGGFKVVYEYANALTARGHDVTVAHAAFLPGDRIDWARLVRQLLIGYPLKALLGSWRPHRWFEVAPGVRMLWLPWLGGRFLPDANVIVATWWRTAEIVAALPASKGRKHYLLQHLETWGGPEERVLATWRLPLEKIVIARWLQELAEQMGERCHYVPNGLRFESFDIDMPLADRPPCSVAMLYHGHAWKGSRDGLEALHLAKAALPELRAELFGTSSAPRGLPDWIAYHENPTQIELRSIYNRAAIFLAPSWTEGWGLPSCEALMCGCALACTDIGGHREYALEGETALTSPPRDPAALARNIVRLAGDAELRLKLSTNGNRFIRQFTWQRAADGFEEALMSGESSKGACGAHESSTAVRSVGGA